MNTETTPKQDEILSIQEGVDGSAVVNLPEDIPSPQSSPTEAPKAVVDDSDEADDAAAQAEIEATGAVDPDAEAMREAKRAKRRARKDYHKQVQAEKDVRLQHLVRENQEMRDRLSAVERKAQGFDNHQITKAIEDQETRILFSKQKIKEATETGNGDLMASAYEMLQEATDNYKQLRAYAERMKEQPAVQQKPVPDPVVQRYAADWMSKHSWYDPAHRDADSKVAMSIDQALTEEGFNPKTREYWQELDNRLQNYLPHRYTEDNSEPVQQRQRPRSAVTSTGRESSNSAGRNTFTLSPEQVRAMKDAGMWDDQEKRNRMIKRYATEARLNQGNRS
jgi:hypothetical protein